MVAVKGDSVLVFSVTFMDVLLTLALALLPYKIAMTATLRLLLHGDFSPCPRWHLHFRNTPGLSPRGSAFETAPPSFDVFGVFNFFFYFNFYLLRILPLCDFGDYDIYTFITFTVLITFSTLYFVDLMDAGMFISVVWICPVHFRHPHLILVLLTFMVLIYVLDIVLFTASWMRVCSCPWFGFETVLHSRPCTSESVYEFHVLLAVGCCLCQLLGFISFCTMPLHDHYFSCTFIFMVVCVARFGVAYL